jgi:hypothetical protein
MEQGDVVSAKTFEAIELSESGKPTRVSRQVDGWVIVTQTCDLARQADERPFAVVCPIVTLGPAKAASAARGHEPRYAPLPRSGPSYFADLDEFMTVSKRVLEQMEITPGLSTDVERRRFGYLVGRKFSRAALPDDVAPSLSRLVDRIKDKQPRRGNESEVLASLDDLRVEFVEADGDLTLTLLFVVDEQLVPDEVFSGQTRQAATIAAELVQATDASIRTRLWDELVKAWIEFCVPTGKIIEIVGEVISVDELTVRRLRNTDPLDLEYLSQSSGSSIQDKVG